MHYLGRFYISRAFRELLVECIDKHTHKIIDGSERIGVKVKHTTVTLPRMAVGTEHPNWLIYDLTPIGRKDPRRYGLVL